MRHGDRLYAGGTEGAAERGKDGRFHPMPEFATAVREVVAHDDWLFFASTRFHGLRPALDRRAGELENRNYYGLVPTAGLPGWYVHGANEGVRWARFEGGRWITQGPLAAFRGQANVLLESPAGIVWAAHQGGAWQIDFRAGLRTDAPARPFRAAKGMRAAPAAMFLLGGRIVALAAGRLVRFDETTDRFVPETRVSGLDALVGTPPVARPLAGAHVSDDGTIRLQGGPPTRDCAIVSEDGERWRVEVLPGEPLRLLPTALSTRPRRRPCGSVVTARWCRAISRGSRRGRPRRPRP